MPEAAGAPTPERPRVVAFAGPSLHRELAGAGGPGWEALLAAVELRPPARRGDLLAAAAEGPDVLVLLDGYYFTVPAVIHKEILYALEAGIRVIGGASLGALRAAELDRLGMEGAGRVYGWFRDGVLDGDDEVAVLHLPAAHGYRPITAALVEVRAAAAELAARGAVPPEAADRLVAAVKALPFNERHLERVGRLAEEVLNGGAAAFARALDGCRLKAEDCRLALERALDGRSRPMERRAAGTSGAPRATGFFSSCREHHLRLPAAAPGGLGPTALETCHALLLLHPEAPALVRAVRLRWLLAAAAERSGEEPEPDRVAALAARLAAGLEERFGRALLPAGELAEEAALHARAEAARACPGGVSAALERLARDLGVPGSPGSGASRPAAEALLELLASDPGGLPLWALVRAALCTAAAGPARDAAAEAAQVARCLTRWAAGRRLAWPELVRTAAELWHCPPERVCAEAARRGLYRGDGATPGLRAALELVAAAERLPEAVNRYPEARERLRGAPLRHDLEPPGLSLLTG
jgi:hypothetical protein